MARHYCPNCYKVWHCEDAFPCVVAEHLECSTACLESQISSLVAKRAVVLAHQPIVRILEEWPPLRVGEDGD